MDIVTNTSLNTFCLCEKRYYWRYIRGYVPQGSNFYLDTGIYFHDGIDYLLSHGMTEENLEHAKYECISDDGDDKSVLYARFMLDRYFEYWTAKKESFHEVIETEQTIGYPLKDGWWYFGKMDGLVSDKNGNICLLEHKTTYKVDSDYMEKTSLDPQITRYMLAVQKVFEMTPDAVLYNVICRPRKYKRKGESLKSYLKRNVEEYRTCPGEYIARQKAFRKKSDLDRELENINWIVKEIEKCKETEEWIMNTDVCFLRSRKCPYTDLCKNGDAPEFTRFYDREEPHPELDDDCLIPDGEQL